MAKTKQLPHHDPEWKGYTLEELNYMRAYTLARIEINRDRLGTRLSALSKSSKKGLAPMGIAGKILGAFSYIDMAVIAWKVGAQAMRIFRTIKH